MQAGAAIAMTFGKEMKSIAKYGCLFGASTVFAQILLVIGYRIAHWKFDYTQPGGFHFGGSDFAVFEAIVNGIALGLLFGVAFTLLASVPPSEFREHKGRLIICLTLTCIPLVKFASDVNRYRSLDLMHRNYIAEHQSNASDKTKKPNKAEMATPRKPSD